MEELFATFTTIIHAGIISRSDKKHDRNFMQYKIKLWLRNVTGAKNVLETTALFFWGLIE